MPNWSNVPPKDPRGVGLPIIRTPAGRPLVAIVTSEDLLGCSTHWYKGRTVPCDAPNCTACSEGFSWRWHGYFGAFNPELHKHFIVELTAQACDPLIAYREQYKTLRGCMFEAVRTPRKFNGRVTLRCKQADLQKLKLPDPPNLENALSILWNLPTPAIDLNIRPPAPPRPRPYAPPEPDAGPKHIGEIITGGGNSPTASTTPKTA